MALTVHTQTHTHAWILFSEAILMTIYVSYFGWGGFYPHIKKLWTKPVKDKCDLSYFYHKYNTVTVENLPTLIYIYNNCNTLSIIVKTSFYILKWKKVLIAKKK